MVKTCMYYSERVACTCTDLNQGGGGEGVMGSGPPSSCKIQISLNYIIKYQKYLSDAHPATQVTVGPLHSHPLGEMFWIRAWCNIWYVHMLQCICMCHYDLYIVHIYRQCTYINKHPLSVTDNDYSRMAACHCTNPMTQSRSVKHIIHYDIVHTLTCTL